jgi:lipoyl-dependent peroxiredoxin subunit D
MMNLEHIKARLPEYARDVRLNLSTVLGGTGTPGLTESQALGTALACAVAAKSPALAEAVEALGGDKLDPARRNAARAAAAIMAMNNVYYRFTHFVGDEEYRKLPARLRMNVIGNPGIDKAEFELYSLAVSAINGCEFCIQAHERVVRDAGIGREGVQSAARIAAVIAAAASVLATAPDTAAAAAA